MALSQYSWKLALPLLVMMAIAASGAAQVEEIDLPEPEDAAPVATAGRGRFLANYDDEIHLTSRRLLGAPNFCSLPPLFANCTQLFPGFQNAKCCPSPLAGIPTCFDVEVSTLMCGSCNNTCAFGQVCCSGVCANFKSDPNNCGKCGKKCINVPCTNFMCGYNGI